MSSREIRRHLKVSAPKGPTFEDLASAPRRLGEALGRVESIPILGPLVQGAEDLVPQLAAARVALAEVLNIENTLKSHFGIDVENIGRNIDSALDFGDHSNTVRAQAGSMIRGLNLVPVPRMEFTRRAHSSKSVVGDIRGARHAGISVSAS